MKKPKRKNKTSLVKMKMIIHLRFKNKRPKEAIEMEGYFKRSNGQLKERKFRKRDLKNLCRNKKRKEKTHLNKVRMKKIKKPKMSLRNKLSKI
jgi:hypothetical protein